LKIKKRPSISKNARKDEKIKQMERRGRFEQLNKRS